MPLFNPYKGMSQISSSLATTAETNPGWTVTSGASSSTKGAWQYVFSSMYFNTWLIKLNIRDIAAAGVSSLASLDIGIGPASSEQVVVSDLLVGGAPIASGNPYNGREVWVPLFIPQGSRVSVRIASQRTSTAFKVVAFWYGGGPSDPPPWRLPSKITTYGIGTVPNGTSITPGASGGTGGWTQITAATSRDHFGFFPTFQVSGTTVNDRSLLLQMGLGGSGAEQTIQSGFGWIFRTTTSEEMFGPLMNPFPAWESTPAGTRLVLRASNTGANDTGPYQAAIHAFG